MRCGGDGGAGWRCVYLMVVVVVVLEGKGGSAGESDVLNGSEGFCMLFWVVW